MVNMLSKQTTLIYRDLRHLLKVFTEYTKSIQYQNSQRANSILTNEVFALIYSYLSMLERKEAQGTYPAQTTRHKKVRNEIAAFSAFKKYNP